MLGVWPLGDQVSLAVHDPVANVISRNYAGVDDLIR